MRARAARRVRRTFTRASVRRALLLGLLAAAAPARAEDCTAQRPSDLGGYFGYAYGADDVATFDGAAVRVWYARSGTHAVRPASTRPDGVPDDVAATAAVADAALAAFASWAFRAPLGDGAFPACASNGGDARLDVYLVSFTGSDGLTATEQCTDSGGVLTCPSFVLVESRLDQRYGDFGVGARTVVPHELFHAVQNAYDAELARFWAEGSAQWAAARLDPALDDLVRRLPAFFADLDRPLDVPPGGVVASWLYGSAVWPVFLEQRVGLAGVRAVFEAEAASGAPALEAADGVLLGAGSSLTAEYAVFSRWNAATGTRAPADASEGYAEAARYPLAPTTPWTELTHDGVSAGLSARHYAIAATSPELLELTADPARIGAWLVPLAAGRADLAAARELPARLEGEGIVVVAGRSLLKSDARFTLHRGPAPPLDAGPDAEVAWPDAEAEAGSAVGAGTEAASDSGCTLARARGSLAPRTWAALLVVAAGLAGGARRRT